MWAKSKKRKGDGTGKDNWQKRQKVEKDEDVLCLAPREVSIIKYAESHAAEINQLSQKLIIEPCGQQVSQKLPRHMRRRAMGHDMKRLPRSVRNMFTNKPATVKQNKRPSRKHRRRPKNLLAEYTRRQRKHIWLETHIWHAKRFHMVEKWGCKIPWKPNMKSERACYRATSRHCMIQDLSYMCCIELCGEPDILLGGLSHLTSNQTGQTFAAVSCLSGTREGQTTLYHYDNYPCNAIGPVSFMWNPSGPITTQIGNEATNQNQLWIWCHPSCFEEVWNELIICFGLIENKRKKDTKPKSLSQNTTEKPTEAVKEDEKGSKGNAKKSKEKGGNSSNKAMLIENPGTAVQETFKTDTVAMNADTRVQMKSLSGDILRFRLTGPESNAILVDTLQQASIVSKGSAVNWWSSYYKNSKSSECFEAQNKFLEKVGQCISPAELPSHCVVAMTTRDPRLTRPVKRASVVTTDTNVSEDMSACKEKVAQCVSMSPLWKDEIREEVTSTKMTDHQIHQFKSDKLVSGFDTDQGDDESRVPVIVIQRPGTSSLNSSMGSNPCLGRGSGFDILLPKGWAMPFWLGLVFRGARCGGLKEMESVAREERSLVFPNAYPDTRAGEEYDRLQERELIDKYNKIPPAKRPNYTKLNIASPFKCAWETLIRPNTMDEVSTKESRCVNGAAANVNTPDQEQMDTSVSNNEIEQASGQTGRKKLFVLRSVKVLRKLQKICEITKGVKHNHNKLASLDVESVLNKELDSSIIPVTFDMVVKGCPGNFAQICLPKPEDLNQLEKDKNYGGSFEPLQEDPVLVEKNKVKKELKEKGIKKKVTVDRTLKPLSEKGDLNLQTGSREVIGYVSFGGFALGSGNGSGVGYVAASGLRKLLKAPGFKVGTIVLVRSSTSLQYRFARLRILV